ncbi:MAG: acetyl-CoA carboxylase biotin carboxyl carrier protein subunit [Dehalococcoidia bacterium]|tara:strand:+ start:37 stop:459 length:423 start_codon:yes stop_codon:yes gene_type:complete
MVKKQMTILVNGKSHIVEIEDNNSYPFEIYVNGKKMIVSVENTPVNQTFKPSNISSLETTEGLKGLTQNGNKLIRSPMPGKVISVPIKIWDYIEEGTELCVIESMKMQQSLLSGNSGFVRAIFIHDGDSVNTGDVVVQIQ